MVVCAHACMCGVCVFSLYLSPPSLKLVPNSFLLPLKQLSNLTAALDVVFLRSTLLLFHGSMYCTYHSVCVMCLCMRVWYIFFSACVWVFVKCGVKQS